MKFIEILTTMELYNIFVVKDPVIVFFGLLSSLDALNLTGSLLINRHCSQMIFFSICVFSEKSLFFRSVKNSAATEH